MSSQKVRTPPSPSSPLPRVPLTALVQGTLARGVKLADVPEYSLTDVLDGRSPEPFTKKNFKAYLEEEYADENLEFYNKVVEFQDAVETNDSTRISSLKTEITEMFVAVGAPREINISDKLRRSTIASLNLEVELTKAHDEANVKKAKGGINSHAGNMRHAFDDAVNEVLYLLASGPFHRFIEKGMTQNLNDAVAGTRFRWGVVVLILVCLMVAGLLAAAHVTQDDILLNPALRLVFLPLVVFGSFNMFSGYLKICPLLAWENGYATCDCQKRHVLYFFSKPDPNCPNSHEVAAPVCSRNLKDRSTRIYWYTLLFTILAVAVFVVLPPSSIYPEDEEQLN